MKYDLANRTFEFNAGTTSLPLPLPVPESTMEKKLNSVVTGVCRRPSRVRGDGNEVFTVFSCFVRRDRTRNSEG